MSDKPSRICPYCGITYVGTAPMCPGCYVKRPLLKEFTRVCNRIKKIVAEREGRA